jgi:hypothetical protein
MDAKKTSGVGKLSWREELGVVESQEVFMFPCGFIFRVTIPLYLVELSLVGRESWWDGSCRSSLVPTEWCLRQLHQSNVSDIIWVGRRGTHYVLLTSLTVAPLDRTLAHTYRWWDIDRCSGELGFLWCRSDIHLSLGRLTCIRDSPLQTSRDDAFCRCSFSDRIGQSGCLHEFVLLYLLPLSRCRDQI